MRPDARSRRLTTAYDSAGTSYFCMNARASLAIASRSDADGGETPAVCANPRRKDKPATGSARRQLDELSTWSSSSAPPNSKYLQTPSPADPSSSGRVLPDRRRGGPDPAHGDRRAIGLELQLVPLAMIVGRVQEMLETCPAREVSELRAYSRRQFHRRYRQAVDLGPGPGIQQHPVDRQFVHIVLRPAAVFARERDDVAGVGGVVERDRKLARPACRGSRPPICRRNSVRRSPACCICRLSARTDRCPAPAVWFHSNRSDGTASGAGGHRRARRSDGVATKMMATARNCRQRRIVMFTGWNIGSNRRRVASI